MWTFESRNFYDRSQLRHPSDLTDEEWALIEPLIPLAKRGGGKRTVVMREVVNGVMYVLSTPVAHGGLFPKICRRAVQCMAISTLELGRNARTHPSCPLCEMPRKRRTRSKSNGGDHRQPEREKR